MERYTAKAFYQIGETLEVLCRQLGRKDVKARNNIEEILVQVKVCCEVLELPFSMIYVEKVISEYQQSKYPIAINVAILADRMKDELGSIELLQIPPARTAFWADDPQFGAAVARKFPKATTDIQEAGKCLALGRTTAAVFHLMRAMEHATKYLGTRLGVSLASEKNWANILDEVDKAIKGMPIKPPRQKAHRNRLAEASAHLRMVKDAWRNDVMHPKETYTEEEAERVFRNVKDFMVHLATKL